MVAPQRLESITGLFIPHYGGKLTHCVRSSIMEVQKGGMEKLRPHFELATIKAAFAVVSGLNRSFVSRQGADDLEMDDAGVVAVIQGLKPSDFQKIDDVDRRSSRVAGRLQAERGRANAIREIHARCATGAVFDQFQRGVTMARNPRNYPDTIASAESGRAMTRGEKLVTFKLEGRKFAYRQPGWWCSLTDPDDSEGQLVDDDNQVAEMARRTAKALAHGEKVFVPVVIRAIRQRCGLTQREAGLVFGTGEKSFEKYESGEIHPSGPTKRLLKMAAERPELFRLSEDRRLQASSDIDDSAFVREALRAARVDELYQPLFAEADAVG